MIQAEVIHSTTVPFQLASTQEDLYGDTVGTFFKG